LTRYHRKRIPASRAYLTMTSYVRGIRTNL